MEPLALTAAHEGGQVDLAALRVDRFHVEAVAREDPRLLRHRH
jgi:hypothetical protein